MDSWFTATCGVSPLFLRLFCPSDEPYRNDGGASFSRKDAWGNIISLDGFYQIASGITLKPSYLWYKHSTTKNQDIASTYIIYQCPQSAKDQIISILQETPACLLRPLSVDALILAEQLNHWGTSMYHDHSKLRPIMSKVREHEEFPEDTVYNLHFLSEHFHAVRAVLEDLKERTEHLLDVYRKYPTLMRPSARLVGEFGDVEDSLAYLLAQTRTLMRWVGTYIEHTQIAVGLLFNLDTASIAKSTQQDSSSMITMAAVTMFFLPGTFVSALFSMVFFNADPSNTGLLVNSQLWLFFVITVPLTVAVFLTWELWRRWRVDSQRKSSPSNKRTASPDADDINPDEGGEALAYGLEEGGAFRASPSPTSSLRGGTKLRTHRHSTLSR
ncbi:hypothetical protein HYPSUDRAFT_424495 [Hypholoma sublateritium FD-334 SS-4]|uniref:Uncharacterized protein n=1 Tax=Hypholoma sublateritium (strain FD-334 SS-4) TaxID=945553 RepID=A0A0D2MN34_HYPSF|nr:hypothetical protein HYPSUDRAFT_424495 [Hypholoma sublateritium FD-334 SS-4]